MYDAANGDVGGRFVVDNENPDKVLVVGKDVLYAAVRSGPVQVQAVIAIDLLRRRAAVYLHGGLLITIVACNVECAQRRPRHLRYGRPWVAPAGDFLQEVLVKRR